MGAKIRGCQKDTYNEDDDTEHGGRPGYAQCHRQGETYNIDNYTVEKESNDEGDDPFNIEERSTPLHQSDPTMTKTMMIIWATHFFVGTQETHRPHNTIKGFLWGN